jgi:hypothetical protein
MQFSGAPAATAASFITIAAALEHCWAFGWKAKMIGFRVLMQMRGFEDHGRGRIGDRGDAGDDADRLGNLGDARDRVIAEMTPTVLVWRILLTTYSQAKRFLVALSSKTPRLVSSMAFRAKVAMVVKAGDRHLGDDIIDFLLVIKPFSTRALTSASAAAFFSSGVRTLVSDMLFFLLSNLLIQTMGQDGKRRSEIHILNHDIVWGF